ncbi:unnamed protein product [Parnassius apollo]|uniref:(apollo) hypothetical protein n=1 Tax=Parnassius apollo TaxID=110799 RepID=A0A8S3X6E0_PARAO|nr:unnamed protein product [Parnassius apollo]
MEIAVPNASVDMLITPDNETPENIGDISLLQQNQPVSCKKKKQENKLKRILGQSYVTASGKTIGKRQMKELPNCRNKCRKKISDKQRALIHKEVWNLGSYDLRAAFILSLITIQEKKTESLRVEDPDKQKCRQTRCIKEIYSPSTQPCDIVGNNAASRHSEYSRNISANSARRDIGAQAIDAQYASTYKVEYCHEKPTSPQPELTEFPPQRTLIQPDSTPISRASTKSDVFANSLRKYPSLSPERSSDVVERLTSFSKTTSSSRVAMSDTEYPSGKYKDTK